MFDDTDQPVSAEYLQQFEKKLNFQFLFSKKGKKVSTEVLIDHILPQVVILDSYTSNAKDGTNSLHIVTIGKEEYEDLEAGKLRDTIDFKSIRFDATGHKGKMESFSYYQSPLSDHIIRIRGKQRVLEVKKVSNMIRTHQG